MTELREIPLKSPSIFDNIYKILYNITTNGPVDAIEEKIGRFEKAETFPVIWSRKNRSIDLKFFLAAVKMVDDRTIQLRLGLGPEGALRAEEALAFICGWGEQERPAMSIRKMQVYFKDSEPCPAKSLIASSDKPA
jgi:hypothetical protein